MVRLPDPGPEQRWLLAPNLRGLLIFSVPDYIPDLPSQRVVLMMVLLYFSHRIQPII